MLAAQERDRLLELGRGPALAPSPLCAHQLFEAQVARTPDALALVEGDGQGLTYAELNRRANQLAHHLQRMGVGPDALVGVVARRAASTVVALLGVLKAGAAYVPLDPDYPAERLAYMAADAAHLRAAHAWR